MKLFLRYLKCRLGLLLLFAAFALILSFSFVLYHLPAEAVLYPAALCLVLGAVVLAVDFIRVRRRHRLLTDLSEMESELPEARGIEAAEDVLHGRMQQQGRLDVASRILAIRNAAFMAGFTVLYLLTKNLILACAVNADYLKAGAPARGERTAKYNRVLAIESGW